MGEAGFIESLEDLEFCGRGATGVVYRARQQPLNRLVALKILASLGQAKGAARQRFIREIRALGRCDHPNVIRIIRCDLETEPPFLVMDYIEGVDLKDVGTILARWRSNGVSLAGISLLEALQAARSDPPPSIPPLDRKADPRGFYRQVSALFVGAAQGLQHIHDQGLLHRDIKPGNLRLTEDGERLIVMDLGLARDRDETALTSSRIGIVGTLRYVAPEQFRLPTEELDSRIDIYGLGASLYEIVAGRPLVEGLSEMEILHRLCDESSTGRPDLAGVPADLARILAVAVASEPEERYATAQELASDLQAFSEGQPVRPPRPGPVRLIRSRLRRWGWRVALPSLLALILGASWLGWWWQGLHREAWYANVTPRWNVLNGVGRLDKELLAHRSDAYRIISRRGRTERVEKYMAHDTQVFLPKISITPRNPTTTWEYCYDEEDRLLSTIQRGFDGRCQLERFYSQEGRREERRSPDGSPARLQGTEVSVIQYDHDPRGYRARRLFYNVFGSPRVDHNGVRGFELETDRNGLCIRSTAIMPEGVALERAKLPIAVYRYDDLGQQVRFEARDGRNRLDTTYFGYAVSEFIRDRWGNLVETRFLDTDGKPVKNHRGYAIARSERDRLGNVVRMSFHDETDALIPVYSGYASLRFSWEPEGLTTHMHSFDAEGMPILGCEGGFRLTRILDEAGHCIQKSHHGFDEEPVSSRWGHHRKVLHHDADGHCIREEYFGPDERPVITQGGFHRIVRRFDPRGNCLKTSYSGIDGRPILQENGFAHETHEFDERGREIGTSYFGPRGEPIQADSGYHSRRRELDEWGRELRISYFGSDGNPVALPAGYASIRRVHDGRGDEVEVHYLGIDDQPTSGPDGCAILRRIYDEMGWVLDEDCIGPAEASL